jgi:hypothetical protein
MCDVLATLLFTLLFTGVATGLMAHVHAPLRLRARIPFLFPIKMRHVVVAIALFARVGECGNRHYCPPTGTCCVHHTMLPDPLDDLIVFSSSMMSRLRNQLFGTPPAPPPPPPPPPAPVMMSAQPPNIEHALAAPNA